MIKIEEIEVSWREQSDADVSYLQRNFDFHLEELEKLDKEKQDTIISKFNTLIEAASYFAKLDRTRYMDFKRNLWQILECTASAKLSYMANGKLHTQVLFSNGQKDVESDSDTKYLSEVENEQLEELRATLGVFGVNVDDFWAQFNLKKPE